MNYFEKYFPHGIGLIPFELGSRHKTKETISTIAHVNPNCANAKMCNPHSEIGSVSYNKDKAKQEFENRFPPQYLDGLLRPNEHKMIYAYWDRVWEFFEPLIKEQ